MIASRRMPRIRTLMSLVAALALTACASAPAQKQPPVQHAPVDAFAMRKPDQISGSSDKLGELRSVPAAKSSSEPDPQPGTPDPIER